MPIGDSFSHYERYDMEFQRRKYEEEQLQRNLPRYIEERLARIEAKLDAISHISSASIVESPIQILKDKS